MTISPIIIAKVPGKPRACIDYPKLIAITRDQMYPIPSIEEQVEQVSGANLVTTLSLVHGYWQVRLSERMQRYAALVTLHGPFATLVLSSGPKNAPSCFTNLMN